MSSGRADCAGACLSRLRDLDYRVGIAGNQPKEAEQALVRVGFNADLVAPSTSWGVAKPILVFF